MARATISQVAAKAGVAVSTVSRYLNGGYVSDVLSARIAEAVRELEFTPSATARNLSIGRRGTVGVAVESSQGPWFTGLLGGIEEELARRHTSLMLASMAPKGLYDNDVVRDWIDERRVDGLVFCRATRLERALLSAARDVEMPVVGIACDEPLQQGHEVRCDNHGAGLIVARHLTGLGHRRIAFAGGPENSRDVRDRLEGLREGLAQAGAPLREKDISFCESYEAEAGEAFAARFVQRSSSVTAVVLGNDPLALGFIRAAMQAGKRIPEDLSVVGFDGIPEGGRGWPGLTSVRQPLGEMGRSACRLLLRQIEVGDDEPASRVMYQMELVQRESTAPPPSRH